MLAPGATFRTSAELRAAAHAHGLAAYAQVQQQLVAAAPLAPSGLDWRGLEILAEGMVVFARGPSCVALRQLGAGGQRQLAEVFTDHRHLGVCHAVLTCEQLEASLPSDASGNCKRQLMIVPPECPDQLPVAVLVMVWRESPSLRTYCGGVLLVPAAGAAETVRLAGALEAQRESEREERAEEQLKEAALVQKLRQLMLKLGSA